MTAARRRVLISSEEAVPCDRQHTNPCSDYPWRKNSLRGWLGGNTPEQWITEAHSDRVIPCHTMKGPQCAGAAIYRGNMAKLPRDRSILVLPPDREKVFDRPQDFIQHHDSTDRGYN